MILDNAPAIAHLLMGIAALTASIALLVFAVRSTS